MCHMPVEFLLTLLLRSGTRKGGMWASERVNMESGETHREPVRNSKERGDGTLHSGKEEEGI